MPTLVLNRIDNKIGTFTSASIAVPPAASLVTLSADMPTAEVFDKTNTLRLAIEACFDGINFRPMAWSPAWTGGKSQSVPVLTWSFNPASPPQRVRGVLENVTQTVAGLMISVS